MFWAAYGYHPHRNNYKRKIEFPRLRIFSLYWITKAKAKANLRGFILFCKRGLLLWLVRPQHDHCESKCERENLGEFICLSITKANAKTNLQIFVCNQFLCGWYYNHKRNIHPEKSTQNKSSSEQVFLNKFRWVPDSCHREECRSSRKLFEKVRTKRCFVLVVRISGCWVGFGASIHWSSGSSTAVVQTEVCAAGYLRIRMLMHPFEVVWFRGEVLGTQNRDFGKGVVGIASDLSFFPFSFFLPFFRCFFFPLSSFFSETKKRVF